MLVLMSSAVVFKSFPEAFALFVGLNAQFNGSDKIRTEENEIVYYRSDGCQLHGQRSEYEGKHYKSPVEPCQIFNLDGNEKKSSTSK